MSKRKRMTVADYAAQYVKRDGTVGCSDIHIYNLIHKGKLKAKKFGRQYEIVTE